MAVTEQLVKERLSFVKYPGFSRDIVSFGLVKGIEIDGGNVVVRMELSTNDPNIPQLIKTGSEQILRETPGVDAVKVLIDIHAPTTVQTGSTATNAIPGVKHVLAIASGKGGVGKSTVAANIAVALRQNGAKVGLCDCDMYGPSIGLMFGSTERPMANEAEQILPVQRYGIQLMSMGFFLEDDAPAILRGPMVTRYTQQFLRQVAWDELDFLILDLPPGTGDIQLTIVQTVALSGALVVTTPQEVALIDARKAAAMFNRVNVPVLGIVENMSYFLSPSDGKRYDIFGTGGGEREAKRLGVPLLGQIPIDIETREAGDRGRPVTDVQPYNHVAKEFLQIAQKLRQVLPEAAAV